MEERSKNISTLRLFRVWNSVFSIFGLSVLSFKSDEGQFIKTTRVKYIYSILATGLTFANFYVSHIFEREKIESDDLANNLIYLYKTYLGNLTIPFLMLSNLMTSGLLVELVNDFILFDKKNITTNSSKKLLFFFLMFIIILGSFIIDLVLLFPDKSWMAFAEASQSTIFPLYCCLITQQFALCVSWLEDKYSYVNAKLKIVLNILSNQKGKKELFLSRRNKLMKMKESCLTSAEKEVSKY